MRLDRWQYPRPSSSTRAMNKLGIYQFAQVASWTNDEIMWVDDSLSVKGRIERDDWVGQVSELIKD